MSLTSDLELIRRAVELIRGIGSGRVAITRQGPLSPAWADLLEAVALGAHDFRESGYPNTEEMFRWSPTVERAAKVAELAVGLLDPYEPAVGHIVEDPDDAIRAGDTAWDEPEPVDLDDPDGVVVRFRARR